MAANERLANCFLGGCKLPYVVYMRGDSTQHYTRAYI